MQYSNIPTKFPRPFANAATSSYKRSIPDTTTDTNAASFTLGFPPNVFADVSAGGEPMDGRDLNGILFSVTAWLYYLQMGAMSTFDAGIAAAGGYPKYALVASTTPGRFWQSTADNNTTNPDGGSPSNWASVAPSKASGSDVEAGTDDTKFITPKALRDAMSTSYTSSGGYRQDTDGFIQQWVIGPYTGGGGSEPVINITWPIAFPTACLIAIPSVQIPSANDSADVFYQLISNPTTTGCRLQRQISRSGTDPVGSAPVIIAWGF